MPNPGLSDEELKRTVEAVRNATGNRIAAAISANSSLTPIAPGTPHTPAGIQASGRARSD